MSSASIERRVAPRFSVKCTGELASGSSIVAVAVSDMSVTGCGIEIDDAPADALGRTGVLSIKPADGAAAPVMLPVVVSNHRVTGDRARLGLQFRRLDMAQMRGLIGVLGTFRPTKPGTAIASAETVNTGSPAPGQQSTTQGE